MVSIARAHDRAEELAPTLEKLAAYQQVPMTVLQRILNALQQDGLVQQAAGEPPRYLPGHSIERIRLVDILRSARAAEDEGHSNSFRSDAVVVDLLERLEQNLESGLGDENLAELLQNFEDKAGHEASLV